MTTSTRRVFAITSVAWATALLGVGGAGFLAASTPASASTTCQAALPTASQNLTDGGTPLTGATPTIRSGTGAFGRSASPTVSTDAGFGAAGTGSTIGGTSTGSGTSAGAGTPAPAEGPSGAGTPAPTVTPLTGLLGTTGNSASTGGALVPEPLALAIAPVSFPMLTSQASPVLPVTSGSSGTSGSPDVNANTPVDTTGNGTDSGSSHPGTLANANAPVATQSPNGTGSSASPATPAYPTAPVLPVTSGSTGTSGTSGSPLVNANTPVGATPAAA